jgi:membrane protein YqaA with SNARE-associated domain
MTKKKNKVLALNRYYRMTKFYDFLKATAIKGGIGIAIFLVIFLCIDYYFIDMRAMFDSIVTEFSTFSILTIFFVSETIFGLIPPEIFIAWSSQMPMPWLTLFGLASLSYIGGIAAYFIGNAIYNIPSVRSNIETKLAKHINMLRKWGGVFIVIGALLPLPHSIVSMACGLVRFNFRQYLVWALFRYLRFYIYALVIFNVW